MRRLLVDFVGVYREFTHCRISDGVIEVAMYGKSCILIIRSLTLSSNESDHVFSEGLKMPNSNPRKGKEKGKITSTGKKVSYGEKGADVRPGTAKGDSYCARSAGIKKEMLAKGGKSAEKAKDPNSPNNLSRKRWRCKGDKSV